MKLSSYLITASALVLMLSACKKTEEKPAEVIIAEKPVPAAEIQPQVTNETSIDTCKVDWLGSTYTTIVKREKDETLPQTLDENGNKYFDNRISLHIVRADGSEFFNHTFVKTDFSQYYQDNKYAKDGALLGIVYDQVKGDNIIFAASVGSPDQLSDNYCPIVLKVNKSGTFSISKDTRPDEANVAESDRYDEGV